MNETCTYCGSSDNVKIREGKPYCYQCRCARNSRRPSHKRGWLNHTLGILNEHIDSPEDYVRPNDVWVSEASDDQYNILLSPEEVQQRLQIEQAHDPEVCLGQVGGKPQISERLVQQMREGWLSDLKQQPINGNIRQQLRHAQRIGLGD